MNGKNRSSYRTEEHGFYRARLSVVLCFTLFSLSSALQAQAQNAKLNVLIEPEAVAQAGAQWRADGGLWVDSGTTLTSLTTHRAEISFSDVPGWSTPDPVKIWLFNGIDRVTSASYPSMAIYPIGEIPPLQAYAGGKALRFMVFSEELGAQAVLTAQPTETFPTGVMTSDLGTSEGLFSYTPGAGDREPFSVTFSATAPGAAAFSQVVVITPIPEMSPEQTVFGMKTGLQIHGENGHKPEVVVMDVEHSGQFNLVENPKTLRKIVITGDNVVFDPEDTSEESLYSMFNYQEDPRKNADIKEMEINAVCVKILGPLRLPRTDVTINAMELRFEDGNGHTASLNTTPLHELDRAPDADYSLDDWDDASEIVRDAQGEHIVQSAGWTIDPPPEGDDGDQGEPFYGHVRPEVRLNITAFHADEPTTRTRFILNGAKGQGGGGGAEGPSGERMASNLPRQIAFGDGQPFIAPYSNTPPYFQTFISYCHVKNYRALNLIAHDVYEFGDLNSWPGLGGHAIPEGEPGDGGLGAHLFATLPECLDPNLVDLRGGEKGDITSSTIAAGRHAWPYKNTPTDPTKVKQYWLRFYLGDYVSKYEEVEDTRPRPFLEYWHYSQEDWYEAVKNSQRNLPGAATLLDEDPLEFLDPGWLRRALNTAREEYLFGDFETAEDQLSKYAELIDLMESRWEPGVP